MSKALKLALNQTTNILQLEIGTTYYRISTIIKEFG